MARRRGPGGTLLCRLLFEATKDRTMKTLTAPQPAEVGALPPIQEYGVPLATAGDHSDASRASLHVRTVGAGRLGVVDACETSACDALRARTGEFP